MKKHFCDRCGGELKFQWYAGEINVVSNAPYKLFAGLVEDENEFDLCGDCCVDVLKFIHGEDQEGSGKDGQASEDEALLMPGV